jgi:SAM-dependent methyltransferase
LYTDVRGMYNYLPTMQKNTETPHSSAAPSAWVIRFVPLIEPAGLVLDLAAGGGRHSRFLRDREFAVRTIDRDISALEPLAASGCEVRQVDLETGATWPLGTGYDGIIVTNYLHRPLFPAIEQALAPGGILIYETFALGNELFGRPHNPDFLLRPGELLEAFGGLTVVAFEQGEVTAPRRAVIQRIAATAGPMSRLP